MALEADVYLDYEQEAVDPENFRVISDPDELLADIESEALGLQAGERFWIKSMIVNPGRAMHTLLNIGTEAHSKGADFKISTDRYSEYASDRYPTYARHIPAQIFPDSEYVHDTHIGNKKFLGSLANNPDVDFSFSGPPSIRRRVVPFVGADHIKGIFVGDTAYLTDKNFDDFSFFSMHGLAVKITDPRIAVQLAQLEFKPWEKDSPDEITRVTPDTEILIDNGHNGKSVILKAAVEAVKRAGHPGGFVGIDSGHLIRGELLDEVMNAKHKGARVEIVAPRAKDSPIHYALARLAQKEWLRKDHPGVIFYPGILHAKILVTDSEVIAGSHNLTESGVIAGTRELAINSTDPILLANLRAYHDSLVAQAAQASIA